MFASMGFQPFLWARRVAFIWGFVSCFVSYSSFAEMKFLQELEGSLKGTTIWHFKAPFEEEETEPVRELLPKLQAFFLDKFVLARSTFIFPNSPEHLRREQLRNDFQVKAGDILQQRELNASLVLAVRIQFTAQGETTNPVGMVTIDPTRGDPNVYLISQFVTESGQGIGRKLLESIFLLNPHLSIILTQVDERNLTAIAIYRRWGFEDQPMPRGAPPGKFLSLRDENLTKFLEDAKRNIEPR